MRVSPVEIGTRDEVVVGVSLGHRTDQEAERWLHELLRPLDIADLVACTHLVREPYPHVAISLAVPALSWPSPELLAVLPQPVPELVDAAEHVATEHRDRRSGRAFRYPGVDRLTGVRTVADLLASSAVDEVIVLGGAPADPETLVQTRDFVRPQWRNGALALIVTPAGAGRVAPFEVPNPTPCCADH